MKVLADAGVGFDEEAYLEWCEKAKKPDPSQVPDDFPREWPSSSEALAYMEDLLNRPLAELREGLQTMKAHFFNLDFSAELQGVAYDNCNFSPVSPWFRELVLLGFHHDETLVARLVDLLIPCTHGCEFLESHVLMLGERVPVFVTRRSAVIRLSTSSVIDRGVYKDNNAAGKLLRSVHAILRHKDVDRRLILEKWLKTIAET